jgi:hypothetical protein
MEFEESSHGANQEAFSYHSYRLRRPLTVFLPSIHSTFVKGVGQGVHRRIQTKGATVYRSLFVLALWFRSDPRQTAEGAKPVRRQYLVTPMQDSGL